MIHEVEIVETLSRCVRIEAANEDEALRKVIASYRLGEIVLNADDYEDAEFRLVRF